MRLVYIVTVDTDEAWVKRHKEYTLEYTRHITECRLSDALHYDLAYDKVKIEEVSTMQPCQCSGCTGDWLKPKPVQQFLRDPSCKACRNGEGFHDHILTEKS